MNRLDDTCVIDTTTISIVANTLELLMYRNSGLNLFSAIET